MSELLRLWAIKKYAYVKQSGVWKRAEILRVVGVKY